MGNAQASAGRLAADGDGAAAQGAQQRRSPQEQSPHQQSPQPQQSQQQQHQQAGRNSSGAQFYPGVNRLQMYPGSHFEMMLRQGTEQHRLALPQVQQFFLEGMRPEQHYASM